jgi:peptidoglycan/xylan/chitin deacetylase (PgdA/CDA1 family)
MSVVSQVATTEPLVALTFDDGPGPQTPAILDLFREHGGRGTFFVLGESVEGRESTLARTIAEGHEIGNHTHSHPHAMDCTDDELAHDIARCQRLLGHSPVLFRPPYGCWPRHTSTEADRTPTVEALRTVLPELAARGFRAVTVSELLAA